jgi:cell pole-organizing protein PopZ
VLSKYLTNIHENVILRVFDLDAAMGSSSLKIDEPSMEDILASIRRIISDDHEAPQPSELPKPNSSPLKSVLDIAERHVSPLLGSPNEPVPGPWNRGDFPFGDSHPEGWLDPESKTSEPEEPAPAPIVVPEPVPMAAPSATKPATADALLSRQASTSVAGAFGRLSEAVRPAQPQTVEDLMKEMLRPMLKAWLNDNLPSLVERLVRAEIERVTRSRG